MQHTYSPAPTKFSTLPFIPSHPRRLLLSKKPFSSSRLRFSASWSSPELTTSDGYAGWSASEPPIILHHNSNQGLSFGIGGVGASLVLLVSTISYFSVSQRGFNILNSVYSKRNESITADHGVSDGGPLALEPNSESESISFSENVTSEKVERVIIPLAVDSTQLEAFSVLKKLKILEDDVKADELCTRREYCRWLVRMNSLLEKESRHRIIPTESISGSKAAFDDVGVEDVDFGSIQALAEAGIVSSKLSHNSSYIGLEENGNVHFYPDRFVSRLDLIDWKSQLDYEISPRKIDQMMTTQVGFMDMKWMKLDASPGLFKDMLALDKSIVRNVFGKSKRFQPNKPSTKAQAAVALTSGRMTEAIRNELLRIEAECSTRQAAMEDIWSELVERGDIKRLWDEKINTEKASGLEVEKVLFNAVSNLEEEKIVQEKHFAENLKEKVVMDCQRQLLLSLTEEVNVMSEKLASERTTYVTEQGNLCEMLSDLKSNQEVMLDTKSILDAEIEALRILRTWVEDEARKSQARSKVLAEVGRRWKWDD